MAAQPSRSAAASVSTSQRVRSTPCTWAAGVVSNGAPVDAPPHGVRLVGPADEEPDLARPLEALAGQRDPGRRRLGGVVHGDRGGVGRRRGRVVREERGDVPVGADAEHHDVEQRRRRAGAGRRRTPARSPRRRVAGVGAGTRCTLRRVEPERVEPGGVVLGVVAVGVAGGQVALVAPPHVHLRPVDRVARRDRAQRGDDLRAHRPAGQRHVGDAARRLRVDEGHDEPRGGGVGEGLPAAVDDDGGCRCGHERLAP